MFYFQILKILEDTTKIIHKKWLLNTTSDKLYTARFCKNCFCEVWGFIKGFIILGKEFVMFFVPEEKHLS